jgi:hypothetical protein
MATAHQSQEGDLFPTNQFCLGGDLKTGSGSLGVLWCYSVVAAFRVLLLRLLLFGFGKKAIFFSFVARGFITEGWGDSAMRLFAN